VRALDADEVSPGDHESWRMKLTRGASAATIVQYTSGKAVLQGQAPAFDEIRVVLRSVLENTSGADTLDAKPSTSRVEEQRQIGGPWIGTDESGKGDYFGPLVSAAVYADAQVADLLRDLGVQDSKKLSDKRVRQMAPQIRKVVGDRAKVTTINPKRYNELSRQMRTEGKNLNSLLAWGHTRSILDLLDAGLNPGYVIVDQFADASYIEKRLDAEAKRRDLEILQFPKAESDVAVAAASILAREGFLLWLERESLSRGVVLPKGAGQNVIEVGRQLVASQGADVLPQVAKISFKTTRSVLPQPGAGTPAPTTAGESS